MSGLEFPAEFVWCWGFAVTCQGVPTHAQGGPKTHLSELREVDLECLRVVLEAEREHRVEDVLATDRLALLHLALLRRLGRNEANELRDAFLHALLGLLRDLGRPGHGRLHDARHIRYLRAPAVNGQLRT